MITFVLLWFGALSLFSSSFSKGCKHIHFMLANHKFSFNFKFVSCRFEEYFLCNNFCAISKWYMLIIIICSYIYIINCNKKKEISRNYVSSSKSKLKYPYDNKNEKRENGIIIPLKPHARTNAHTQTLYFHKFHVVCFKST